MNEFLFEEKIMRFSQGIWICIVVDSQFKKICDVIMQVTAY